MRERLDLGLELDEGGALGFDQLVALEDLVLGFAHGRLVMRDLVLKGLVFLVLLDLVELGLEIIDLGLLGLEGVLALLELDLGLLKRLAGFFDVGLAGSEGGLAGGERSGAEARRSRRALAR